MHIDEAMGQKRPMNRHERRKQAAIERGNPHFNRRMGAYKTMGIQADQRREATRRRQEAAHKRALLRKKNAQAAQIGVAQTHIDRRSSRYEDKK